MSVHDIYKTSGAQTLHALEAAKNFNRWMADTIRPYIGDRILEVGAGIGNLTQALLPGKTFYIASDVDQEHLARLKARFRDTANLHVCSCDLTDSEHFTGFGSEVDTVVCLNVIEHIEDDLCALQNLHSVLSAGGRALVLVPHGQEIFGTLDEALGHHRRYSREELRNRLETAGFQVAEILEFNRVSRPGWYIHGRILKGTVLNPWMLALFDRFVWLWRRIDRFLPWPSTSLIAVAVKR